MSMKVNAPFSSARTLASLWLISSMAVMGGSTAFAGQIFGFGFPDGPIYSIDAVTGNAVVAAPGGGGIGASRSSVPGQFFITTPVNLWTEDLFGNAAPLGGLLNGFLDLAYDADTATLYGVDPTGLYRIDSNCAVVSPGCPTTLVAALPPGIESLDFVSGAGLYGVSNFDLLLYRIDPLTGQAMPVGPTFGIPLGDGVMDLAYDAETGAFVASVLPGGWDKLYLASPFSNSPSFGMVYRIDRNTGFATLLNGNAPPMLGLAENVPEPSTGVLLLSAIAALLLALRSSRSGSCVFRFCWRMASGA